MEYNPNLPRQDVQTEDNALSLKDIWALCVRNW